MSVKIIDVAHHRNGVYGRGFDVVLYIKDRERRVAILPDRARLKGQEDIECFVLGVDLLTAENIQFGENSYRGDVEACELIPAVALWMDKKRK